jgi:redox-sensitive bicupin YhaK (pirin superfamily)
MNVTHSVPSSHADRLIVAASLIVCCVLICTCGKAGSLPRTGKISDNASNDLLRNSENRTVDQRGKDERASMTKDIPLNVRPLGFFWETSNPFLFCVHHLDHYPRGNDELGPAASLAGRDLGQDFTLRDGWRMYHGEKIPGFPAHPHRGFETVTVVLQGLVDHSDSHGMAGRYGNGDVQWMTAGSGLQHSEMFPLLNKDNPNTLELFQIWINLPKAKKFCDPYFAMLWADKIPVYAVQDKNSNSIQVTVIAGRMEDVAAPQPAPDSWAADPANEVGIWLVKMASKAEWNVPRASAGIQRTFYFYKGSSLRIRDVSIPANHSVIVPADKDVTVENGDDPAYILVLQGKPIDEPVVQHGPFVMNTQEEIRQAYDDYRKTQFGGWPWPRYDNVHPRDKGRFARYRDGREEFR